jgi:mitochondrial fission protein ELM1
MTSEACSTGKPVYIIELEGYSKRINQFQHTLCQEKITRPFGGRLDSWKYPALNETQEIARVVLDLIKKK